MDILSWFKGRTPEQIRERERDIRARQIQSSLRGDARRLGLSITGYETNTELEEMCDEELAKRYYLGPDATFEEQFDHMIKTGSVEGIFNLRHALWPHYCHYEFLGASFSFRLAAALYLHNLIGHQASTDISDERVSKIRELGVMMVGAHYCKSHPESPFETITKLRKAKIYYLSNVGPWDEQKREAMRYLDGYFSNWELALDKEALALY